MSGFDGKDLLMGHRMRVVVESPYANRGPGGVADNVRYLHKAMRDCLLRGEAPFASHAIYTLEGVLDDANAYERQLGIQAGFAWGAAADLTALYLDRGLSSGMMLGVGEAAKHGRPISLRVFGEAANRSSEVRSVASFHVADFIASKGENATARAQIERAARAAPTHGGMFALPRIFAALST